MIHLYARVSGPDQARDDAVSIPNQLRRGRTAAQARGSGKFSIVEYVDKGVSGTIPLFKRPAGKEMWEALNENDLIVAAKLDRLFRSSTDALNTIEYLQKRKVGVILLDISSEPLGENAVTKLFLTMLAAFADFERSIINERTGEGRRGKARREGFIGGKAPYGYRVAGEGRQATLVADLREQEIVRAIIWMWPRKTPAEIVRELASRGCKSRSGKPFGFMQIKRIVEYAQKRKEWSKTA